MNNKNITIPELYKLKNTDREKLIKIYMSAFSKYPKLMNAFHDEATRMAALEATLRYYTAYDLTYGAGFSLDENVHEAILLAHSDNMKYTFFKHLRAGSYSKGYRAAMNRLSKEERRIRISLFEELDRLEKTVSIPSPHIYLDFLGVEESFQHQGRGRKLMTHICALSEKLQMPLMLFTNTADDVRFYQSLGFKIIGETSSEKFGFTNTYLTYR